MQQDLEFQEIEQEELLKLAKQASCKKIGQGADERPRHEYATLPKRQTRS